MPAGNSVSNPRTKRNNTGIKGSVIGNSWMISYQMKFQLSPAPAALPHSRKKLVIRPRETHSWRWIIRGDNFEGTSPP